MALLGWTMKRNENRLNQKSKGKRIYIFMLFLLLLCIFIVSFEKQIFRMTGIKNLKENVEESIEFRSMNLSEGALSKLKELRDKEGIELSKMLAVIMLDNNFDLTNSAFKNYSAEEYRASYAYKAKKRPSDMEEFVNLYDTIWSDVVYFPVPESTIQKEATVTFENSWLAERTYGGKRFHEGTDLMAAINQPDLYPVISMSDGVIEKMGWLDKGGWRIGVRTEKGAYLYYAHLSSYAKDLKQGDSVIAGELLGYMGNSGYGKEGTTGKFDVHLHVGVYITTKDNKEESINPYWILRYLEDNKLSYAYSLD